MSKFNVQLRRKRMGQTDYKVRLSLLKSRKLRLVIRRSNKHISAQLISYDPDGDKVVEAVTSYHLKKYGWDAPGSSIPAAYLTGFLIGKKAKGKEAVTDIGLQTPSGSRIFAAVQGAFDAGLKINVGEDIISKDRLNGKHIAAYAKSLKGNQEIYNKRFSGYQKAKISPEDIPEIFEKVKQKISSE